EGGRDHRHLDLDRGQRMLGAGRLIAVEGIAVHLGDAIALEDAVGLTAPLREPDPAHLACLPCGAHVFVVGLRPVYHEAGAGKSLPAHALGGARAPIAGQQPEQRPCQRPCVRPNQRPPTTSPQGKARIACHTENLLRSSAGAVRSPCWGGAERCWPPRLWSGRKSRCACASSSSAASSPSRSMSWSAILQQEASKLGLGRVEATATALSGPGPVLDALISGAADYG